MWTDKEGGDSNREGSVFWVEEEKEENSERFGVKIGNVMFA